MDITKFYELRTRLYNTAAAGCMTVSEDFRLKRAVEDFKPLASANKAFEKLYALCEKLLSAEKPESVLPDCIALAEALAVTQGTFADSAETTPAAGESIPAQKTASALAAVKELMRKSGDELWKLSADYKDTLRDPRIINAFLNQLETGKFNDNFKIFCEIMCEICGKALVPALKATIKDSGRQLQYIARLSGDEENELFRALATDEECPEKVRLAAISALTCSEENGALLAELFDTGNAKIKQAALLTMAEMDAPEAEPIFEKLLEDYKKNKKLLAEPIIASSGKACTEFVRKRLTEDMDVLQNSNDEKARKEAEIALTYDVELLANKTELDDMYLALTTNHKSKYNSFTSSKCVEALIAGLEGRKSTAVQAQIERLYAKAPTAFQKAKAFSDLLANPDIKPNLIDKDDYSCFNLVESVRYIPLLDGYYLEHFYTDNCEFLPLLPFCKRFPEWVSQSIRDTADKAVNKFNDLQAPTRAEMLEKAKKLGFNDARSCDALVVAYNTISGMVGPLAYCLYELLENSADEDFQPLRQAAMYMIRKCLPLFGDGNFDKMIKQFIPEITPQEHADMLLDFIINSMVIKQKPPAYGGLFNLSNRLSREEYKAALQDLYNRLSALRGEINNGILSDELSLIETYIKQNS